MTATQIDAPRTADDPRPALARTQAWIVGLLATVTPEQLALPTPCTEFDVAALVRHLYGVADRVEALGHGQPAASVPAFAEALPDDLAAGYRERAARSQAAWADDAALSRVVVAPFGPLPGAQVVGVYVSEQLTHGWDLAVATGRPAEADADLAALAERSIRAVLDPLPRGGPVPFGPAVAPSADAGPTARLAAYLGRSPAPAA
ncbi:TIGR03086 family protein [Friedmanniella luteola]|uniref:TIGR03086 family protein n=1 Tax=Friedmanniella luteola TaxID=546871 RepID=A0A1H1M8T6_9ACTN|nr:TIGR03086 family metal-binding protein [Friedmanniella luteola]SDR82962.1 TIGR03086 family protein [Friedmanniella luteola]